jgi:hypothetical protein
MSQANIACEDTGTPEAAAVRVQGTGRRAA